MMLQALDIVISNCDELMLNQYRAWAKTLPLETDVLDSSSSASPINKLSSFLLTGKFVLNMRNNTCTNN